MMACAFLNVDYFTDISELFGLFLPSVLGCIGRHTVMQCTRFLFAAESEYEMRCRRIQLYN